MRNLTGFNRSPRWLRRSHNQVSSFRLIRPDPCFRWEFFRSDTQNSMEILLTHQWILFTVDCLHNEARLVEQKKQKWKYWNIKYWLSTLTFNNDAKFSSSCRGSLLIFYSTLKYYKTKSTRTKDDLDGKTFSFSSFVVLIMEIFQVE